MPVFLSPRRTRILLAALSGIFVAMGFPGGSFPFFSAAWLMPLAFLPLFFAIESIPIGPYGSLPSHGKRRGDSQHRGREAFTLAWIMGVTFEAFAFFWTTKPAIFFGGVPPAATYPLFALYCCMAALFFPLVLSPFIWNAARKQKRQTRSFPAFAMASAAVLLEAFLPRFFQWPLGGLMHHSPAVSQLTSVLGAHGVAIFMLWGAAALARALSFRPLDPARIATQVALVSGAWISIALWGDLRIRRLAPELAAGPSARVAAIQPNFTFSELSSNPERPADAQEQSLGTLLKMTREVVMNEGVRKPDLVVWPESVAPTAFAWSEDLLGQTTALARELDVPILAQAVEFDPDELRAKGFRKATMYSTSFLLRPDGSRSPSFRKWVPIPFGEMVPFEGLFPAAADWLRSKVGNLSKVGVGTSYAPLPFSARFSVAPLICFDSIDARLPRMQVHEGKASIFANQANFVWMDRSNAGDQFAELDRSRAIENGRSLILAANTGPSVAFDPLGREIAPATPILTQGKVVVDLPIYDGTTFYSRFGRLPLFLFGALGWLRLFLSSFKRSGNHGG